MEGVFSQNEVRLQLLKKEKPVVLGTATFWGGQGLICK